MRIDHGAHQDLGNPIDDHLVDQHRIRELAEPRGRGRGRGGRVDIQDYAADFRFVGECLASRLHDRPGSRMAVAAATASPTATRRDCGTGTP